MVTKNNDESRTNDGDLEVSEESLKGPFRLLDCLCDTSYYESVLSGDGDDNKPRQSVELRKQ